MEPVHRGADPFDLSEDDDSAPPRRTLTVSSLTQLIKNNLETSFPSVLVEGEVSGSKLSTSGHLYFSLKDRDAIVQAVMFKHRLSFLNFNLTDGQKVVARASVSVYPARGQYQLIVQSLRKSGLGDILAMLEERKRRFSAERLFDVDRKKPLPRCPSQVGLVTSPTGAALRDILQVLGRRNAGIDVLIFPTAVQGDEAPASIAARIAQANAIEGIDALIIGRGGGSPEDLLAFSDELVVRAVAASRIPVISAVGHEIDWALSDFAADLRAPTPSAAAEMVAETKEALAMEVAQHEAALETSVRARLDYAKASLSAFTPEDAEARFMRIFLPTAQRFDDATEGLDRGIRASLLDRRHRLDLAQNSLSLASPAAVLSRGYSIVRRDGEAKTSPCPLGSGSIVRAAAEIVTGERLNLYFSSGGARVDVVEVKR
ncbi:MAG: exodeoxyribonuclease VII large subunit [Spirochaetes bacterium]|nr:exodeoxyribonuclease VII large subunit [Spirochaetota bacterium]